eukprot:1961610-Prymnesium_polylepis.2
MRSGQSDSREVFGGGHEHPYLQAGDTHRVEAALEGTLAVVDLTEEVHTQRSREHDEDDHADEGYAKVAREKVRQRHGRVALLAVAEAEERRSHQAKRMLAADAREDQVHGEEKRSAEVELVPLLAPPPLRAHVRHLGANVSPEAAEHGRFDEQRPRRWRTAVVGRVVAEAVGVERGRRLVKGKEEQHRTAAQEHALPQQGRVEVEGYALPRGLADHRGRSRGRATRGGVLHQAHRLENVSVAHGRQRCPALTRSHAEGVSVLHGGRARLGG